MAEHNPGVDAFFGSPGVQADYATCHHGTDAKANIRFPAGKKLGKIIFIGNTATFVKTDELEPVGVEKSQPRNIFKGIPIKSVALFSGRIDNGGVFKTVIFITSHPVKTTEACSAETRRSVGYIYVTVFIQMFFPVWRTTCPEVEGNNSLPPHLEGPKEKYLLASNSTNDHVSSESSQAKSCVYAKYWELPHEEFAGKSVLS